ncbi:PQQ-binding-like beta-propeller repeat protein [Streptomyces lunaelactis]|uniref:serine/threonine-protein kinase n=2 Tax=Streptomyces lunaelactis TaxID=1535768 RepID=UPI0015853A65|nr:serine/threonine-protein kinase [Streptomyces lunaelactis]NUK12076.1 PQQ-binding-like beta-propeller repeat protein [Streptomyces lunaelactis]NUK38269.1 PQQ-binding-like beta-propeller repeat protein [Streptomyces lunaelactis]NUK45340.1 PQQ-binding-like beta-propeller repeat protein [Streptomyces lunaelactis]NUK54690.1 PQQ-binding-like beta-propeller repeat protein [Streptomyces lunaelactis]NUK60973.1 PQQ-binding-like beta-propeller repeat protein [Streptomyces lunaelactis]
MMPLGTGDPLRLGPYRLLGVLGEGGMGKVYIGQDNTGHTAAVKVLRPELAHDHNLAQRFVREAQMAQAVTSTGVARVLGAHTEGGRPWIATEFLTGPTLDQAVGVHGPFDDSAVRALAAAIARTLRDIHTAGLVHRDLKPSNIVLTSSGPRVIDFGIARPEHGLTLTTTGEVPITPGYGAPEQVLGQRVGAPADVFSLGAVLVYAASGARAFDGGHVAAVQYEVVHGEPQLGHLPEQLRPLIAPCLSKDPAFRPTPGQITGAFAPPRGADRVWRHGPLASDIKQRERTLHELTTVVSGSGASQRISRRRLITTLAVGGTVLAAGGGSAAWWIRGREEPDPFALPPAAKTPEARTLSATTVSGRKPTPLWGPLPVITKNSPGPLPVRDVIVVGAKNGGIAAHSVIDGKRRWTAPEVDVAGGYRSLSDVLIAAIDTKGMLVTFVASTGEPRWKVPAEAKNIVATDDTAVYVATKNGKLRSISRSNGETLWTVRVPVDLKTKSPTGSAARGRLVVASGAEAGDVVAVDAGDGHELWKLVNPSSIDGAPVSPVISGDIVYINGATLTARSLSDGNELWASSRIVEGKTQPAGPPLIHGNTVYVSQGPQIGGYSDEEGTEEWTSLKGYFIYSPVAVQGNGVFAISSGSAVPDVKVWAIDQDTGKKAWTYPLTKDAGHYWIVGDGNRIFVTNGDSLLALPVFA